MSAPTIPARLLTVSEAAEVLRIPKARVYDLLRTGVLPAVRILRQVRVDPEHLNEFVSNGGRRFLSETNGK